MEIDSQNLITSFGKMNINPNECCFGLKRSPKIYDFKAINGSGCGSDSNFKLPEPAKKYIILTPSQLCLPVTATTSPRHQGNQGNPGNQRNPEKSPKLIARCLVVVAGTFIPSTSATNSLGGNGKPILDTAMQMNKQS